MPLSLLALIVLSHFIEKGQLFYTLSTYIGMMIPGYAATLTEQVQMFLEHGTSVGSFVFLAMLFFGSITFTVLESAMSVIFFHRFRTQHRHFLLSLIIPYVYIFLIGLGILLVSFIAGAIETHNGRQLVIFGWGLDLEGTSFVCAVFDRDTRRGIAADFLLSGHARGAHHVPARSFGRDDRDGFMGDHPPCVGLVLLSPLCGKCNLRFFCYVSGGPAQFRSDSCYYFAGGPDHCRT